MHCTLSSICACACVLSLVFVMDFFFFFFSCSSPCWLLNINAHAFITASAPLEISQEEHCVILHLCQTVSSLTQVKQYCILPECPWLRNLIKKKHFQVWISNWNSNNLPSSLKSWEGGADDIHIRSEAILQYIISRGYQIERKQTFFGLWLQKKENPQAM